MSEILPPQHLGCPVLVLTINEAQVVGDDLCDALRDEMLAHTVRGHARNVILDFHKVVYVSSAGFRPLLSLHRILREHGGRLILCGLSPEVEEVFEVTRLISTRGSSRAPFEVQKDVPSAVAALYQANPSGESGAATKS
jgi:anti-anti-sigma regulatory factor